MLNTQKLLYILPDVTYVAELLPTKKEHTFSVQSFRQINGQFLDEENLIPENIEKLFGKIEAESYHLILPDFLFTNTIVEVKETQEAKVKTYIKDELLPSLGLSKDTHEIETFILTQYNGVSKVQLTALERSVLDPIVTNAHTQKVEISGISPLSWTIKSIVSLEPSITAIQIGNRIYLGEHYIGVDQCTDYLISEIESAIETIKTLKGSQPSIQTIYLLTNELVEDNLKEHVSSTLPIQQLASAKDNDSQMPSYVKQIIEAGLKTLDISDYPVPKFALPKQTTGLPLIRTAAAESDDSQSPTTQATAEPTEKPIEPTPAKSETETESEPSIEEPSVTPDKTEDQDLKTSTPEPVSNSKTSIDRDLALIPPMVPASVPLSMTGAADLKTEILVPPTHLNLSASAAEPDEKAVTEPVVEVEPTPLPSAGASPKEPVVEDEKEEEPEAVTTTEPDLRQFAGAATTSLPRESVAERSPSTLQPNSPLPTTKTPLIIKNKSGTGSMLKMIFITLAVFCATVAVGVGIGLGVLSFTNRSAGQDVSPETSPSPIATPSPVVVASPSPTASSSATFDASKTSVLVVNATTTPGYAGSTKAKLDAAKYKTVKAANAKGDYEDGTYILMKTEDPVLEAQLEKDSGLTLTFTTGYATEDPKGEYSAVIVLAE